MQALLSPEDFTGALDIAGTERSWNREALCPVIAQVQGDVLTRALGLTLCAALSTGLDEAELDTRWTDLRDGCVWMDATGRPWSFAGLKRILLCHTYYEWNRQHVTQLGAGGSRFIPAPVEGTAASPAYDMKQAWNEAHQHLKAMWWMFSTRQDGDGALLYSEFNPWEAQFRHFSPVNLMGI